MSNEITSEKQHLLDERYLRMASIWAENSYCVRRKVGALIVKDKMLYAFIDGRDEPYAYVKLGDAYDGGYVSIFSGASNSYGFGSFTISENITTPIPAAGGAEQQGDEYTADFDTVKFDSSGFTSYYLEKLSGSLEYKCGLGLPFIGETLYSDYNDEKYLERQESLEIIEKALGGD